QDEKGGSPCPQPCLHFAEELFIDPGLGSSHQGAGGRPGQWRYAQRQSREKAREAVAAEVGCRHERLTVERDGPVMVTYDHGGAEEGETVPLAEPGDFRTDLFGPFRIVVADGP